MWLNINFSIFRLLHQAESNCWFELVKLWLRLSQLKPLPIQICFSMWFYLLHYCVMFTHFHCSWKWNLMNWLSACLWEPSAFPTNSRGSNIINWKISLEKLIFLMFHLRLVGPQLTMFRYSHTHHVTINLPINDNSW